MTNDLLVGQDIGSSSVAKAFAILDFISDRGGVAVSLNEVSRHISASKSTAHRYLQTLEAIGAVERDERDNFRLGLKLIELSGEYLSNIDVLQVARPFLNKLASLSRETVYLAVPSGSDVVYVAKVDSTQTIAMRSRVGSRAPLYCTALGKAMLSRDPHGGLISEVSRSEMIERTPNTITSFETLQHELEDIRQRGYAIDNQENEMGVCCVGAPLMDYREEVVGAISVSAPANRMERERQSEVGAWVRRAALDISIRLGYPARLGGWPLFAADNGGAVA